MHNPSTNRARYQPGKVSTGQRPPCEHADLAADTGPFVVLIQTLRVFALQKPLTTCHPHFKGPTPGAVQLACCSVPCCCHTCTRDSALLPRALLLSQPLALLSLQRLGVCWAPRSLPLAVRSARRLSLLRCCSVVHRKSLSMATARC